MQRLVIVLGGLAAVVGLGLIGLCRQVLAEGAVARPEPADAVVVLGAAVWGGGQPSPALYARSARGAELVRQGYAPRLIATGGIGAGPPSEAEVIARVAQTLGVPAEAILLEPQARSTRESAERVAAIMASRGWRRAIIVSDPFHLLRARLLFREVGLEVSVAGTRDTYYAPETRRWHVLRESLAIVAYLADHPIAARHLLRVARLPGPL